MNLDGERGFRALIQHSADAVVVVDRDGTVRFASDSARAILGYAPDELVGKSVLSELHPEDVPAVAASLGRLAAQPARAENARFRRRNKDGEWRWLEATGANRLDDPAVGGIVVNFRDVTERELAERHRRILYELVAALSSTLDLDTVCDTVVTQVATLVGALRCVVLRYDPSTDLFHYQAVWDRGHLDPEARGRGFPARLGARALRSEQPVVIADTRTSDDSAMVDRAASGILSVIAVRVVVAGTPWGVLQVGLPDAAAAESHLVDLLTSVTTHVSLAVRNAQLYTDLRETHDRLRLTQERVVQQERLRALGEMASGIAHDLNNALAPVVGFSELLLEMPGNLEDKEKARRYLGLIRTGAGDAASVVTRLREFYRHRDQHDVLTALDLAALVAQVLQLTEPKWKDQAQAGGGTIAVSAQLDDVPGVVGSESELREALTNLVFNAVDAMPRGGTLILRTRTERGDGGDQWGVIEIADTGVGMTEEVRRRCLEPFFTTKGAQGTGLGLSMVLGIVERHGGTIDVQSAPGAGTRFLLRFPLAPAEALSSDGSPAPAAVGSVALRLLVVDDEPPVRTLIQDVLAADGHDVVAVSSAQEALAALRTESFHAVLTDRAMPGMNGDHLALAIKRAWPELPVVLVTGFGDFMAADGELPEGVDAVVGKPVDRGALRRALQRVCPD